MHYIFMAAIMGSMLSVNLTQCTTPNKNQQTISNKNLICNKMDKVLKAKSTIIINAPASKVWEILTNAEKIQKVTKKNPMTMQEVSLR